MRSALSLVSVAEQSRVEGSAETQHTASTESLIADRQLTVAAEALDVELDEPTREQPTREHGTDGDVRQP